MSLLDTLVISPWPWIGASFGLIVVGFVAASGWPRRCVR